MHRDWNMGIIMPWHNLKHSWEAQASGCHCRDNEHATLADTIEIPAVECRCEGGKEAKAPKSRGSAKTTRNANAKETCAEGDVP